MTIKSQGGIFGRNPTFNNVTVGGVLTVDQIVEKTGAAGITLDGVTLKDGNVVLADGKGIDFSATAGTGTSELFDDYEEGLWTPNMIAASGTITLNATLTKGSYTKIGRQVTLNGLIYVTSVGSPTGTLRIIGLPFTPAGAAANYEFRSAAALRASTLAAGATTSIQGNLVGGDASLYLFKYDAGVSSSPAADVQANTEFVFSITYFTT